jgi:dephospho-CoA kinase
MTVIVLVGKKGSGKDTVADHLTKSYGFERIAFADNVRRAVSLIYDLPFERLKGLTAEDRKWREEPLGVLGGKTPRRALQLVGTEIGRLINKNTWVEKTWKEIENSKTEFWVITDCRFINEVKYSKSRGAYIVYLERPSKKNWFWKFIDYLFRDRHPSEMEVERIKPLSDIIVVNDGTIEELYRKIDTVLSICPQYSKQVHSEQFRLEEDLYAS